MAAVQAAAPLVSWAWIWGMLFCWGWLLRSGSCAAVVCADQFLQAAGCLFYLRSRTAKAESLPICEVRVRISAPARAAVIFVPSLSNLIRSPGVRAQETGRRHGTVVPRAASTMPVPRRQSRNLHQSGLFWLLSPSGYRRDTWPACRSLWGHIKSFYVIRTGNEGAYGA